MLFYCFLLRTFHVAINLYYCISSRHADKDNDKAIESFNKVIALDPKHGEAHLALSTAYYFKGDFETAKKHLAIAETLLIESAELLSTLKEDENMRR